jgi:uncharacterized protein YheU (UPF0270 family)
MPLDYYRDTDQQPAVEVPHEQLSPEALRGVIESFVLREGTEYGERDVPLDTKIEQVLRQIERGEAQIMFDPNTETIDVVVKQRPAQRVSPAD